MLKAMVKRYLPWVDLACAILAGGLWYTQGGAVWYAGPWPGPLPLILLAIPWLVRWMVSGPAWHPSSLDVWMVAFLVSAGVGVWAAYDAGPAWAKFWLIVGAAGLGYAVARQPDVPHLHAAAACLAGLGCGLSLFFLATNDWSHNSKVPMLTAAGRQLAMLVPALPGHRINANVAGGMLAAVLPFWIPLLAFARQAAGRKPALQEAWRAWGKQVLLWGASLACAVSLLAWLMSMSRAAWLSLASMGLLWLVWWLAGRWAGRLADPRHQTAGRAWKYQLRAALLVAGAGVMCSGVLMALMLAGHLPGQGALTNRLDLLRDSATLARDYGFTGAGLGTFQMQQAIYALLIHVGYIVNSHNLFLDLLIEQGWLGLGSFLGLVITASWLAARALRSAHSPDEQGPLVAQEALIAQAALASLGTILIHGLVDDALYGSRGLLILFAPFGFVAALAAQSRARESARTSARQAAGPRPLWRWGAGLAGCMVAAGLASARQPLLGAWHANLGAVEQARVELGHYDQWHFDNPTLDQVRQQQNLDAALRRFEQALQADPANPTARQRLAAIALARREYARALQLMQGAWDAGHRDSVTRLLLGDAHVANGQVEAAVQVTSGQSWAARRLAGQAWSRYWVYQDYSRAADAWQAAVLLDPSDTQSAQALVEATRRAGSRILSP